MERTFCCPKVLCIVCTTPESTDPHWRIKLVTSLENLPLKPIVTEREREKEGDGKAFDGWKCLLNSIMGLQ